jgi:hypothetical protein
MTTLQNLIDYCEAKEIRFELYGVADTIRWNHVKIDEAERYLDWDYSSKLTFGFEYKPNVYYWFDTIIFHDDGSDLTMDVAMSFDHRYNRANGVTQKGFTRGWECQREVAEFIEELKAKEETEESKEAYEESLCEEEVVKVYSTVDGVKELKSVGNGWLQDEKVHFESYEERLCKEQDKEILPNGTLVSYHAMGCKCTDKIVGQWFPFKEMTEELAKRAGYKRDVIYYLVESGMENEDGTPDPWIKEPDQIEVVKQ